MSNGGPGQDSLAGWLPYQLDAAAQPPRVHWFPCTGLDYRLPFFADSVAVYRATNRPPEVVTDIEALHRAQRLHPGLAPQGLMFHVARSGSTLLANVWAALPNTIAVKSAPPVDACLRMDLAIDPAERAAMLTSLIGCLGQRFRGTEQRYFVKFMVWNIAYHALIRRCFPTAPTFYLYRHPLEVLVSWLRLEPTWPMEPVDGVSRRELPKAEYYARVVGAYLTWGLELAESGAALGNYSELGSGLIERFLTCLGVTYTAEVAGLVERQRHVHSKRQGVAFVPDAEEKQRVAPPEARDAVDRWAMPAYDALERLRHGRSAR